MATCWMQAKKHWQFYSTFVLNPKPSVHLMLILSKQENIY
jgi:hypothetical protein